MNYFSNVPDFASARPQARLGRTLLLLFHILTCCLSLVFIAEYFPRHQIVMFDEARVGNAVLNVAPFAVVAVLFVFGRFSFGYFLGFYFYSLLLGYLWLVEFSKLHYDHQLASISAFVSGLAFLAPALFIRSPIKQRFVLSERALDHLLSLILVLAATIVAAGAFYNFRLIGVTGINDFRADLEFPALLRYAFGATINALLPFAFACFALRGKYGRAATVLVLLLLFYPITLTKVALFAPFWLLFILLLSRFSESRTAVLLSLFLPAVTGVILVLLSKSGAFPFARIATYLGIINFRMIAYPSVALDVYNDFFSTHDLTHFCQISLLKPFVNCPYTEYLSVMMAKAYGFGNLNASLFATEGIASVGPVLAPLTALASGLVIALGNRLSSGLPATFVLLSGGVLLQAFVNIPLTTNLFSNGAAILFLLWYLTPRTMFEPRAATQAAN
jgi:hypothetical protein